jgi:regulator of replication initiation timing
MEAPKLAAKAVMEGRVASPQLCPGATPCTGPQFQIDPDGHFQYIGMVEPDVAYTADELRDLHDMDVSYLIREIESLAFANKRLLVRVHLANTKHETQLHAHDEQSQRALVTMNEQAREISDLRGQLLRVTESLAEEHQAVVTLIGENERLRRLHANAQQHRQAVRENQPPPPARRRLSFE